MLLSLSLLFACGPANDTFATDSTDIAPDTEADTESVGGVDEPEPEVPDHDWVFDDTVLHQAHISLSDAAQDALRVDPYTWVEGTFTYDGSEELVVGVRLRGKIGSFQELDEKPKWKIDFNRYVDGQTFHGLETLAFNNSVVDCSYLRELMAYKIFNALDVPASRMAFSWITMNDQDYGLYQVLEFNDDVFLDDRFGPDTGNLYDGKYIYGGGWDYTFVDFTPEQDDNFALEEGKDVGLADVEAITETLREHRGEADFYEGTGELIAWDEVHPFLAAEQWTGQWDGYTLDTNNYRVYFDPALDGRVRFLTTDLDYAFYTYGSWFSWDDPTGELVRVCYRDPVCYEAQRQAMSVALDVLGAMDLVGQLDTWTALARDWMLADPRGGCSGRQISSELDAMTTWVQGQDAELRAFWGL